MKMMMNGAQALIRTLVGAGINTCFTNPGTSEIHFVAALDSVPEMRAVLTLFEGVATGAADGYARMSGAPAATLLHLGPGLGYGLANLHNARRAKVPVLSIVGDHATYHAAARPAFAVRHRDDRAQRLDVGENVAKRPGARPRRGRGDRRRRWASRPSRDADRARRRLLAGGRAGRGASSARAAAVRVDGDRRGHGEDDPRQRPGRDLAWRDGPARGRAAGRRARRRGYGSEAVLGAEHAAARTRRRPARGGAARVLARARG